MTADGRREVLGLDVGDSEDGAFWTAFLRSLKARGLPGVQLVISDAHTGPQGRDRQRSCIGAAWQRCRVHFMRNVLARVPKGHGEMVAAAIRTVFAQPDAAHVSRAVRHHRGHARPPAAQGRDHDARGQGRPAGVHRVPASALAHRCGRTNPLERLNKEIKRRTDVVGVFPNPAALLRLAGAVLVEAHDEWAGRRQPLPLRDAPWPSSTPPQARRWHTPELTDGIITNTDPHERAGTTPPSGTSPGQVHTDEAHSRAKHRAPSNPPSSRPPGRSKGPSTQCLRSHVRAEGHVDESRHLVYLKST